MVNIVAKSALDPGAQTPKSFCTSVTLCGQLKSNLLLHVPISLGHETVRRS